MKKQQQTLRPSPLRLTLKGWAALEDIRQQIEEEAERGSELGNFFKVSDLIYQYIEQANDKQEWDKLGWLGVSELFLQTANANKVSVNFPILAVKPKDANKQPWEYTGRTWFFWLNVFAKSYGWAETEIEMMDVDTAIGLYQEITLEKQMREEWEWGLSEMAYAYNPSTKKSHYKPLERPEWMRRTPENFKPKKPMKTMIRKDMLPQGSVINLDMDNSGE